MANKKVWKYYINGKETTAEKAYKALHTNSTYISLIKKYPEDEECVKFWESCIKDVVIRKEDEW